MPQELENLIDQLAQTLKTIAQEQNLTNEDLIITLYNLVIENFSPPSKLTTREIEISTMLIHGFTTKDIMQRLHISINTVKKHKNHIRHKLNIPKGAHLIDHLISLLI